MDFDTALALLQEGSIKGFNFTSPSGRLSTTVTPGVEKPYAIHMTGMADLLFETDNLNLVMDRMYRYETSETALARIKGALRTHNVPMTVTVLDLD